MKRRILLIASLFFMGCSSLVAQEVAFKTNALYWGAMGSPNAGIEIALGNRWTIDIDAGMNLWKFDEAKRFNHWAAQPELRYWFCETFNGHFIGIHGHGGQFSLSGFPINIAPFKDVKNHLYEGYFYGAGLSYGYQFMLGRRWNLELSLGGGFARIHYDKYPCASCGTLIESQTKNYFGITRAAISLIYIIK